jgi:hypothetical protein
MATVQPGSFLTLHYRLAGPAGDIINTFDGKPATLSLGSGELSPAVEQRLIGLEEGVRATFELAPGEAFGERKADMVQWVARKLLDAWAIRRSNTPWARSCSSLRPMARASTPARCARWATTARCCSTSTTRWPASR